MSGRAYAIDRRREATPAPPRHLWKRAFDVAFALVMLLFIAPLLLIIAAGLLIADGRPIFYRQKRIGYRGREFGCLKFRSMAKDADARLHDLLSVSEESRREWEASRKLASDPRIHPLGRILRRTSLDELPQFMNVLKGDMSVVGPRPIVHEEMSRYGAQIAHYTSVRPGVTGLWQVSGRNSVSYNERVTMDVEYVGGISPAKDAKILLKTVRIVLTGAGDH
ncbi:sugar transferase [Aureimonas populi]|uniref:Sugar transferase n=1 Tax=Aureimonas populi TaxID=1701758 RepID=A0ABW5CMM1_9HYPH|nr:sugar transferase [Aureimonas populi]